MRRVLKLSKKFRKWGNVETNGVRKSELIQKINFLSDRLGFLKIPHMDNLGQQLKSGGGGGGGGCSFKT